MTRRTWLAENASSGTTITTANFLAVDSAAAALVANGGTGTIWQFSNTQTHLGLSASCYAPSGNTPLLRLPFPTAHKTGAISFYHYAATPGASLTIGQLRHASGIVVQFGVNVAGNIFLTSANIALTNSAGTVPHGQLNRYELVYDVGTTTSNGSATLRVFAGDSLTPVTSVSVTGVNMTQQNVTQLDLGRVNAGAYVLTQYFDSIQMDDSTTSEIGPYIVANAPPTVTMPAHQSVSGGATVNLTATASDSDGTIASRAWTVDYSSTGSNPTLTGAATANVSFTAPAAGHLVVLKHVVTDDDGATAEGYVEVRTPKTGAFTTLIGAGTGGAGWTTEGGAASEGAALADASNTTYVESPIFTGTASARRWRIQPLIPRESLTLTPVTSVSEIAGTVTARLYEGATLRQSWTLDQSTSPDDQVLVVSSPASITDWENLWFETSVVN